MRLQVGVLVMDRLRYGSQFSHGAWAAFALILAAKAYLILTSNASTTEASDPVAHARLAAGDPPDATRRP